MTHSIPMGRRARGTAQLVVLGTLALTLSACHDVAAPTSNDVEIMQSEGPPLTSQSANAIPDEYIVVFEEGTTDPTGRANALAKAHGADLHHTFTRALPGFSAHMSAQAAEALRSDPSVALVEPDRVVTIAGGVQTGAPWGLDRLDQASATLDGNYSYPSSGTGVNVYIIDTGIRRTHTQFGGRVVPAFSVINDAYGADGCQWHGTHVAGVVGAAAYGVAKDVTLHSVRVTDCTAATVVSNVIAGVDWVTNNHRSPSVAVLSLSTGLSLSLNAAVQNSINSGVTYVVAAGNNSADACNYSPASTSGALTVAAITGQDAQASYTNVGGCVDLYAPGTQIYAPVNTDDNAVALYSGTSQSAGFVAGAAALYLEANPGASPAQVSQAIISGVTAGAVTGLTGATPNRILRVSSSGTTQTPPPPPPPTGNTAPTAGFTVSCQKASCSFDASSSRDDAGVVSYVWNFGDATSLTNSGPLVKHVYGTKGSYTVTVTLTVTDAAGLTGSTQKTVSIRNNGK
jgi:subtilisin family serine protease